MILQLIQSISATDSLTAALVAIIESHPGLQETLTLSKDQWLQGIQKYFTQHTMSTHQQAACVNTFLFFSSNPLISMTAQNIEHILQRIFADFAEPSACIHCFHDEGFHELPLNYTRTLGIEFLREHTIIESFPEVLDDVLDFYRFTELFMRAANQIVYTKHVARCTLPPSDYAELHALTLQHGTEHLMLRDDAEQSDLGLALVIKVREQCGLSCEPIQCASLGMLLSVREMIFNGDFRINPNLKSLVSLILTKASLLLYGLNFIDRIEMEKLSRVVLTLQEDDIPPQSPLANGHPMALADTIQQLAPDVRNSGVLEMPQVDQVDPLQPAYQDPTLSEEKKAAFFAKFNKDFETGLKSVTLDHVIQSEEASLGLPSRDIAKISEYVFFLLAYCLKQRPEGLEVIKALSAEDKKILLNELKLLAQAKNKTYQQFAFNIIHARFGAPTGIFSDSSRDDPEHDHEYAFSISRDVSSKESRKQAAATVRTAQTVFERVASSTFVTAQQVPVQYEGDKISSCLSRWGMRMEGARFHIVSVSGRGDGPVSGGVGGQVLDSEGEVFNRNQFYDQVLNERTLFADYPVGIKPVLFVLMQGMTQLSKQPCDPPQRVILADLFHQLKLNLGSVDIRDPRLDEIYKKFTVHTLVTKTFRGKIAVLIAANGLDEHIQGQLLALCNVINVVQGAVSCAVIDTLPANENQLLSALLRIKTHAKKPLKNEAMPVVPTRSLCAELSIVPAMALVISLLGVSPLGLFNSPISTAISASAEGQRRAEKLAVPMDGVDGELWHPCTEYCDHRRLMDKLFLESARNEQAFFEIIDILFDGELPHVIRSLADLNDTQGRKIGVGILAQNQVFVAWARNHVNPHIQALFAGHASCSPCAVDKDMLVRTISTDSRVSDAAAGAIDFWLEAVREIVRTRPGPKQLLALKPNLSPWSAPVIQSPVDSEHRQFSVSPGRSPERSPRHLSRRIDWSLERGGIGLSPERRKMSLSGNPP